MASLIPGYEYDIFISYRQKDNKYDGWVTSFVENLKKELEATFKEEIGVYFDINPHDGLLETYDVEASLKEKLKCLIFIPVISRTYCDPKSFAWEYEFNAFGKQASEDRFGLKVKLHNGNIASRILPVQIYDLDAEDKNLIESALGGALRAIEFIYKEPGVNRPLSSNEERPEDNLNKTLYRNQINKCANAVKEIISGLKSNPETAGNEIARPGESAAGAGKEKNFNIKEKSAKKTVPRLLTRFLITAILVTAAILIYPKLFKKDILGDLRTLDGKISVAVMPFKNMSNDSTLDIWQDGIQNELITSLTTSDELRVRQTESIRSILQSKGLTNYASIIPSVASTISQQIDAAVFIYGTIKQTGEQLRLNAQLIDSKTEETYKSFQIDGDAGELLIMIDSLSSMLRNSLIISGIQNKISKDILPYISTTSPEAYTYYMLGEKANVKYDNLTAIDMFSLAIKIDSNFSAPYIMMASIYGNMGNMEAAKKWFGKVDSKTDRMTLQQKLFKNFAYAVYFENPNSAIKYGRQLLEFDDQSPLLHYNIGVMYSILEQYDDAIPELEKVLGIYNKWGTKPGWSQHYTALGFAYSKAGQKDKQKKLFEKAEQDFPDDPAIYYFKSMFSLQEGDMKAATQNIEKYKSIIKNRFQRTDEQMPAFLAGLYADGNRPDEAEKYYRDALRLEPDNPEVLNNFAMFLIDNDRDIKEGIAIADKSLKISADNFKYLDTKGWGMFKLGNYDQAKKLILRSDSLRMGYDHRIFIHKQELEKVIADQKFN